MTGCTGIVAEFGVARALLTGTARPLRRESGMSATAVQVARSAFAGATVRGWLAAA